jgi:hypothetical protein
MRYRLRTLLIVLALGPVVIAGLWWAIQDPESASFVLVLGAIPGLVIFALLATAIYLSSGST